jgi:hypothetical protein
MIAEDGTYRLHPSPGATPAEIAGSFVAWDLASHPERVSLRVGCLHLSPRSSAELPEGMEVDVRVLDVDPTLLGRPYAPPPGPWNAPALGGKARRGEGSLKP